MKKIFSLFLLAMLSWQVQAQEIKNWSLEECIEKAWENNINVQQIELNKELATFDVKQARASRYPNLSGSSSLNFSSRSVDPTNNQFAANTFFVNGYSLSTGAPIYQGGLIKFNIEKAKMSVYSSELQIEDQKLTIALQTASAYLNVLFANENVNIAQNRVSTSQGQLDQINSLIKSGLRAPNDIFSIEATLASDDQNLIVTQGNQELSKLNLLQIMREDPSQEISLIVPEFMMNTLQDPFMLTLEQVYNEALGNQPSVKRSGVQIKLAQLDQRITKAGLYPSLFFGANIGSNYSSLGKEVLGYETSVQEQTIIFNGNAATIGFPTEIPIVADQSYFSQLDQNITFGYGLNLSIPIYNNSRTRINMERSRLSTEQASLNDLQVKDNLRQSVQQALTDARVAKKTYEAARKSEAALLVAYNNMQKRSSAGAGNSFDLSQAKIQYDSAVTQTLISKYDLIFKMKIIDFYQGKPLTL